MPCFTLRGKAAGMIEKTIFVKNKSGLHARPAYSFVNLAKRFASDITIFMNGETANAKSLISVLGLGIDCGATLRLRASGNDEGDALDELIALLDKLATDEH